MQNHLEISSKTQFWTRNVRNWTKSRDLVMSGLAKTCPGGQILTANQRKYFYFSGITHLKFLLQNPTSPLGWGGLGLRLFQSSNWEGLPFPLPPSLGCGSRGSRGVIGHLFGARFEPPFFHHLGPPKIVITSYFGSKAIPFWGPKRGPKQAPTSELAFSLIFLGFLIFSIPPQVPPV